MKLTARLAPGATKGLLALWYKIPFKAQIFLQSLKILFYAPLHEGFRLTLYCQERPNTYRMPLKAVCPWCDLAAANAAAVGGQLRYGLNGL